MATTTTTTKTPDRDFRQRQLVAAGGNTKKLRCSIERIKVGAMGRQAPTFELLPGQRSILERLSRQRTVERRIAERVQIVLWSAAGRRSVEQAALLGVDPQRILRWRHRWHALSGRLAEAEQSAQTTDEKLETLNVEALSDEERSGSPGKFSAEQLSQIVSAGL